MSSPRGSEVFSNHNHRHNVSHSTFLGGKPRRVGAGSIYHDTTYQKRLNDPDFNLVSHFGGEMLFSRKPPRQLVESQPQFVEEPAPEEKLQKRAFKPTHTPDPKPEKFEQVKVQNEEGFEDDNRVFEEISLKWIPYEGRGQNNNFCGSEATGCKII